MSWSNYAKNQQIDWLFRGQALSIGGTTAPIGSGPTVLYVAAYTTAPTDAGGGVEVVGGGYVRIAVPSSLLNWAGTQGDGTITVSTGTNGKTSNNNDLIYPDPTAAWGSLVAVGIFDAPTGGDMLAWTAITPFTVNGGDPAPGFVAGSLIFYINNCGA